MKHFLLGGFVIIFFAGAVTGAFSQLIQPSDLTYRGAFRLPEGRTAVIEAAVRSLPSSVQVNGQPAAGVAFNAASQKIATPRPTRLRPNYVRVPIAAGESRVRLSWQLE